MSTVFAVFGASISLPLGWALVEAGGAVADAGEAVSLERATIERAATGDPKAQAWLARRVLPKIRRVARALASTAADADDAAQLSLLEVLASIGTYRGESSLDAWVGRVAARTTLRHLQRERRKSEPVVDAVDRLAARDGGEPLTHALARDVQEYLDRLPAPQREAIVLHHALGHSLSEIAEMEDASANTIKSRLRLGMAALRKAVRRDRAIGTAEGRDR